jgi:hypothetical protein
MNWEGSSTASHSTLLTIGEERNRKRGQGNIGIWGYGGKRVWEYGRMGILQYRKEGTGELTARCVSVLHCGEHVLEAMAEFME